MRTLKLFPFFIFVFITAAQPLCAAGKGFDHSTWDAFLKKYVNEKGEVNYGAVKKDPSMLLNYLELLSTEHSKIIAQHWPREEALAFWMNAYNAGVIKLVIERYPIKNIQQIPSAWDITIIHTSASSKQGETAGPGSREGEQAWSLNDIRMKQLLGVYRDEKIHLALSCGARGCPQLQRQAFTGTNVEGQLFLATRSFLNDPKRVEIIPGAKKIKLSRLFKWYEKDFNLDFGTPERIGKFKEEEMSVLSFLAYYLENADQVAYLEEGRYKIEYFPFDWTLNDWIDNIPPASYPSKEQVILPKASPQEVPLEKA